MLTLVVQGKELWDDSKEEFVTEETVIEFEHSLVSLSKWESMFEKPFLGPTPKTTEETLAYILAMRLDPKVPSDFLSDLTNTHIEQVNAYIGAKMTATWFADQANGRPNRDVVTAELIYYWMISLNIPMECQEWHLNRLLTLIRVINEKNAPQKKLKPGELAARNRELNRQRREQMGTKG